MDWDRGNDGQAVAGDLSIEQPDMSMDINEEVSDLEIPEDISREHCVVERRTIRMYTVFGGGDSFVEW